MAREESSRAKRRQYLPVSTCSKRCAFNNQTILFSFWYSFFCLLYYLFLNEVPHARYIFKWSFSTLLFKLFDTIDINMYIKYNLHVLQYFLFLCSALLNNPIVDCCDDNDNRLTKIKTLL